MLKYVLDNGKSIELSDKDYVAEGGEGKIYCKGNKAYKICFDGKVPPIDKLMELKELNASYIIRPENVIYDKKKIVGYSMQFLPQSSVFSLCQLFSKAFRDRENISHSNILDLVKFLRNGFDFVHSKNVLIVDANEFNFLVDKNLKNIYFIDVNSYQTEKFPATAIMSSIRDWSSNSFSKLTDWYSFAILSFQMFVGIHPTRGGNNPAVTAKDIELSMIERCRKNISVLNKNTKYPIRTVQPFSCIPKDWYDWYNQIFEQGRRTIPPHDFQAVAIINSKSSISTSTVIKYTKIFDLEGKFKGFSNGFFFTDKYGYSLKTTQRISLPCEISHVIDENCLIEQKKNSLLLNGQSFQFDDSKDEYYRLKDIVYKIENVYGKYISKQIGECSEHSTLLFNGGYVQNWFTNNLFRFYGNFNVLNIRELKGHKILDCLANQDACVVSSFKDNKYYVSKIWIDGNSYVIKTQETKSFYSIVAAIIKNGLIVMKNEDEDIEISNKNGTKIVKDDSIGDIDRIYSWDNKIYFVKNNTVYLGGL